MMKLKIVLIAWVIVLSSLFIKPAFAEDICLPSDTVSQMTVDLEKYQLLKERYNLLTDANKELEKQAELLEKIVDLQKQQNDVLAKTNEQYKQLIEDQSKMYKETLKASKPSIFERVFGALGIFGVGALIGILVL
jgi:hypothetical protein